MALKYQENENLKEYILPDKIVSTKECEEAFQIPPECLCTQNNQAYSIQCIQYENCLSIPLESVLEQVDVVVVTPVASYGEIKLKLKDCDYLYFSLRLGKYAFKTCF